MPINIPYTFVAGTKAKAAEVNADFQNIKEFVDGLEIDVDSATTAVASLQANKANLNGQADEIFSMADPVGDYDGVNKRTLINLTANTRDAVTGFVVSKQTNTSVNCTPGACWDVSYTKMIQKTTSMVKTFSALSANATYYIYVTMDATTENVDLSISTSSVTPEVTTNIYYRRLATLITDSNGYVDIIINDYVSSTNTSGLSLPDYASKQSKNVGTTYTADKNGYVFFSGTLEDPGDNGEAASFYINNTQMGYVTTWKYKTNPTWTFPVSRNDTYRVNGSFSQTLYYYVPCKN